MQIKSIQIIVCHQTWQKNGQGWQKKNRSAEGFKSGKGGDPIFKAIKEDKYSNGLIVKPCEFLLIPNTTEV